MMRLEGRLSVAIERHPIAGAFTIARGSRTEAVVVVATIEGEGWRGRGECVPYARYGETVEGVAAQLQEMAPALARGIDRTELLGLMTPGAARNALDCALWDGEAKRSGRRAFEIAGLPAPVAVTTAYTLSLGTPESMAAAARVAADRPLLKVKLGGAGDAERIAAVRATAPKARLIVDANEGWTAELLEANLDACRRAGVELVEQPLPAAADEVLAGLRSPVPLCADESAHGLDTLERLCGRYDAVNVKLDKTGGLTEALAVVAAAKARGLAIMVGCMVGTSLAMAPALLLAGAATWVDLDGPLLLQKDRPEGLRFRGSTIEPASSGLWG